MLGIECNDTRECFAKQKVKGVARCGILSGGYPGDTCPFCKPKSAIKRKTRKDEQNVRRANRERRLADYEESMRENEDA